MINTQIALGLIAITMLSVLLLYFATIKYVGEVLGDGGHEHDDDGHAA
jgi:hypothetical protein